MQEIKLQECGTLPLQENLQNSSLCCQVIATWYSLFNFLGLEVYMLESSLWFFLVSCSDVTLWVLTVILGCVVCPDPGNRYRHASSLVEHLTPYQEDIGSNTWLDRQLSELHWWSWRDMSCCPTYPNIWRNIHIHGEPSTHCSRHNSHNTSLFLTFWTPISVYWRELCREACRDTGKLNRLASS